MKKLYEARGYQNAIDEWDIIAETKGRITYTIEGWNHNFQVNKSQMREKGFAFTRAEAVELFIERRGIELLNAQSRLDHAKHNLAEAKRLRDA